MDSLSLVLSAAAESTLAGSAAGPVGLIAVTAGVGGLVFGLVRKRKPAVAPQNERLGMHQRIASDVEQV